MLHDPFETPAGPACGMILPPIPVRCYRWIDGIIPSPAWRKHPSRADRRPPPPSRGGIGAVVADEAVPVQPAAAAEPMGQKVCIRILLQRLLHGSSIDRRPYNRSGSVAHTGGDAAPIRRIAPPPGGSAGVIPGIAQGPGERGFRVGERLYASLWGSSDPDRG